MTHKLSDNEIIQALEQKIKFKEFDESEDAIIKFNILENALDLINRLQSHIEKCERVETFADKTIAALQAEIDRLNALISKTNEHRGEVIHAITHINEIKAEGAKDFKEKLLKELHNFDLSGIGIPEYDNGYESCFYAVEDTIAIVYEKMVEV